MCSNSSWDYVYSCPYCGDIVEHWDDYCLHCHSHITPFKSLHEDSYYANKSNEKYGVAYKWKEFVLEEVKKIRYLTKKSIICRKTKHKTTILLNIFKGQ